VMPSADSAMPPGFSKAPWAQEKRPPSLARMKRTSPLALNPFQDDVAADGRLVGDNATRPGFCRKLREYRTAW
jgi:hypothetical protein